MEALNDFLDVLINSEKLIRAGGFALLILIIYLETGVFFGFIFAGDSLLFSAGILCGTAILKIPFLGLLFALTGAAIAGSLTGYYSGKVIGKRLFTRDDSWFFKKRYLEKSRIFYGKYGGISLIAGRFIWIVRTFIPILAGTTDMSFRKFNLFNVAGAFLWVWTIVPLGYLAGRLIPKASDHILWFVFLITLIALAILIRGIYKVVRLK